MDAVALVLLLVMGIIISSTSGRYNSEPEIKGSSGINQDEDAGGSSSSSGNSGPAATQGPLEVELAEYSATSQLPHHITNQHQLLRKLSQAFENSNRKRFTTSPPSPSTGEDSEDDYSHQRRLSSNHNSNHHFQIGSHHRNQASGNSLRRIMLRNTSVTCNDGTTAGYYVRHSFGSKRWIVFLEGGWYCFSASTCHQRWLRMRNLMSSAHWPEVRSVGGMLSSDPEENPFWWNANHVLVPYCSSDSWSGDSMANSPREFSFLGARIIEQVILELLPRGLYDAKSLLLAGSSAGAGGVLVNLDRIADLLTAMGSKVEVRGLADSGWFLDNEPFDFHTHMAQTQPSSQPPPRKNVKTCLNTYYCAPVEMVKQGIKLWNGQVPSACRARHESEPWRCFFGYRVYQTLRTPLFVVQWLFDQAQMTADNVGSPISKAQWNYVHKMGQELRKTLENVTAVFSPSCISHIILNKRDWGRVKVNGISLPQALRCWELQTKEHNHHDLDILNRSSKGRSSSSADGIENNQKGRPIGDNRDLLSDSPTNQFSKLHQQLHASSSSSPSPSSLTPSSPSFASSLPSEHTSVQLVEKVRRKKRKRKHRRRHQHATSRNKRQSSGHNYNHERHRWLMHEDLCHHFLLDSCSWPQCNSGCPKLYNPFTGEEVDFKEILKLSGFDMTSVANAFGVDEKTLNEMDQETLFHLMSQHTQ